MTPQRSAAPSTAAPRRPARVAFVGAGPGDASLMTVAAVDLLARADAVITDRLTSADVLATLTADDVDVVDASHGEHGQQLTHAMRAKLVVKTAKAHRGGLVVRLMDGDPATFNGLAEEAQALVKADIDFDVVPGVSAVSAVPTYAGVPLTARSTGAVHVVSLSSGKRVDLSASVGDDVTLVLLGLPEQLEPAFASLLSAGRAGETPVAVTRGGTTTQQTTRETTLAEAAEALEGLEEPTLAVVGPTVAMRETLSWFETKPLYGWKVLVPRTKDQAGPMTRQLLAHGATSEVVPTISVEPPRTPQAVERAVRGLVTGRYQWIGFTSVNAVKAIREKFQEFGLDARAFSGLKIAAVGGVTADALREWGLEPDLVPSGELSARGLLEEWPPYDEVLDPIDRVFLPRADIATDTLVAGLQDMGWQVDDVTAYRTVRATPPPAPVRDAIKQGAFDAVVFTSSSTVRNLVGIAGKPHASTIIACIGPATVKTAEEAGLRVDVMAAEATGESLVEALADHGRELAAAALEAGEEVTRPSERRKKSTSRRKAKG
ncbi:bifunctional uroporphyrinogen-III C-methyltransferase/uroporphyrinogen-III synthase [Janibacter hoylei PVAS-1]|uniref:Bifunctional uroporphyrinogen-III C-methyltransferase/uroporphyrinogen-III synthase n=1 Tax=Janibacter hoylei PVAS-1 TaxID=1210046 RepID=A0A444B8R4_9MICO|nr:uroporphyrinogen-III synthase [Janibacter hoylei]RWU84805.1 bifunctional uroporphyrinogen-III C-methyltransferase/uroporphyrinogen-III synthase [Janibacter hoylei PVAS-1]